ncbi:hypothetical protein AgCh_026833 [Apium graveolens]
MGCFRVTKGKKKMSEPNMLLSVNPQNHPPAAFPKSPSCTDRVKPIQPNNSITNTRARGLSAPSSLDSAEQDALSVDYEEQLNLTSPYGSMKKGQNPNPQPLPLPVPPKAAVLKNLGSIKVLNARGLSSNTASQPLPSPLPLPHPFTLPQSLPAPSTGMPKNFSYEELATASNNFCLGRWMSGGLSSMIYRAPFGDNGRLSLIMDLQLQGHFPAKAARLVADIIQSSLQTDPSERPTMRAILEYLKVIQHMKFTSLLPLPEPGSVRENNMCSSQKARLCVSPSRSLGLPLSLPFQSCSSTLASEEFGKRGQQLPSSSIRKSGVEGF